MSYTASAPGERGHCIISAVTYCTHTAIVRNLIMPILQRRLPSCLLINTNEKYFFGLSDISDNLLQITHRFSCSGMANIYLTISGAIGYEFADDGELASIDILEFRGSGAVPGEAMENRDAFLTLQRKRLLFANFISATIFGRHSGIRHKSLEGAIYGNLETY